MKVFFLDTNIFLQCQDLTQLPWDEVSDGKDLLLLIPRPAQEEIDRLKNDGNSRRAKRARKASAFIRNIVLSENEKALIRDSGPKVEVSFPPPLAPTRTKSEILDLSRPDDRIVEEALAYREVQLNENVALLTHDTNLILTAKQCGLSFTVVPDSWLLPPEPDPRDKKIIELEQKVRELEKSYPRIKIIAQVEEGDRLASLPITVTTYEALPEQTVKELMAEMQGLHPITTDFNKHKNDIRSQTSTIFAFDHCYQPPSEFEIQRYKETGYPQWLEKVEKLFRELDDRLEFPTRHAVFSFVLSNQGTVPAENIVVQFRSVGGLLLKRPSADDRDEDSRFKLPSPPTPPEGKWVRQFSIMDMLSPHLDSDLMRGFIPPIFHQEERDRHAFYSRSGSSASYTECLSFECDEFRHQINPEVFDIEIVVPPMSHVEGGAIQCVVTAKNLHTPLKEIFPVQVEYKKDDTLARAKEIVEKERQETRPKLRLNIGKDGKVRMGGSGE